MKITNLHGLPEPLVRAVSYTTYNKGDADYSVTELVKPPRIAALEKQHWDELEEDASERLWLLMGSAGHEVLRRSSDGGIVEERCTIEVAGKKVSGQMDYAVPDKALIDYKLVSLWAIKDGVKPEWEQQINCYKEMADQYGVVVNDLQIVALLRDWNINEAARNHDMPQSQVVVLPVRIWEKGVAVQWMTQRIALHEAAHAGNLPNCTPAEMWERPETYAAMKRGNKRASKVEDTRLAIGQWIASQPKPSEFEVEVRPGERPRCKLYCSVGKGGFCEQFNQWKGQKQ